MLLSVLKDIFRGRGALPEADVLRVARELNGVAKHDEAIKLLTSLIERKSDCVDALVLRGVTRRLAGRPGDGMADLQRAAALAPHNPSCLFELASSCKALDRGSEALEYCRRVLEVDPSFVLARWLQAEIQLGDEYYYSVLDRIHAEVKPRTYVEIGVFRGESLRRVKLPTQAIGIDPNPQLDLPLASNQRLFTQSSEAFLARHDLRAEFGGVPVDLAFIYDMHHFDFALRDFSSIERYCMRQSSILLHNAYPLDRYTARRDGSPPFWSGDIWRFIVLLKKYRPDLSVHTISTPPTGLALVGNLDPQSTFLTENYERLRDEFIALDYGYLDEDKPGKLNLIPNDWDKIRPLLGC